MWLAILVVLLGLIIICVSERLMNTMADVLAGITALQAQVAGLPPGGPQLATQDQIDTAVTGLAAVSTALTGASGPPAA